MARQARIENNGKRDVFVDFGDAQAVFGVQAELSGDSSLANTKARNFTEIDEVLSNAQRLASRKLATYAKNMMQTWLRPKGAPEVGPTPYKTEPVGIGFTGASADALYVNRREIKSPGGWTATVREKGRTPNINYIIRHGQEPGSIHAPIDKLKEWVVYRDLSFLDGGENKSAASASKSDTRARQIEHTAYRVLHDLIENGSSVYYPENQGYAPGARFFNYPQKFQDEHARSNVAYVAEEMMRGSRGLKAIMTKAVFGVVSSGMLSRVKNAKKRANFQDSIRSVTYEGGYYGSTTVQQKWRKIS